MKKRVEVPQSELFRAVKSGVIHIPIPDDWQPLTDRHWMRGGRGRTEANFPHSQVGYVAIKRYCMVNYITNGQKWSAPSLEVTVERIEENWYWVVVTHPVYIVIGVQNAS